MFGATDKFGCGKGLGFEVWGGLFGAATKQDGANRAQKDLEVEENRPIADIIDVKSAPFLKRDIAAPRDLGQASEAGFDREEK